MLDENQIQQYNSKINEFYDKLPRPSWDEYFLMVAFIASLRSEDPNIKHGAVIVDRHNHIVGTGYNGPIKNSINSMIPMNIRDEKRKWMIHAEENAILNSIRSADRSNEDFKIYVTGLPCNNCLQRIINFNIKTIIIADRAGSITENEESQNMREKLLFMSGLSIKKISCSNIWIQKVHSNV